MTKTDPTTPTIDPIAAVAAELPLRDTRSILPEPYASRMAGRDKRPIGDWFGLKNFGVNLTRIRPGSISAFRHAHALQDEFIFILEGHPILRTDAGDTPLAPGMCAGFRAGSGNAHHLVNESREDVVYLEVGDRAPGDTVEYPDEDLRGVQKSGAWCFLHKDGTPY